MAAVASRAQWWLGASPVIYLCSLRQRVEEALDVPAGGVQVRGET
jgi:hypothetical protein